MYVCMSLSDKVVCRQIDMGLGQITDQQDMNFFTSTVYIYQYVFMLHLQYYVYVHSSSTIPTLTSVFNPHMERRIQHQAWSFTVTIGNYTTSLSSSLLYTTIHILYFKKSFRFLCLYNKHIETYTPPPLRSTTYMYITI